MSLRFRLNLLITSMFLGILLAGAVLVIHNARTAVAQELRSTANLTLQLLEVAFLETNPGDPLMRQSQIQNHINTLGQTRHLKIEIRHGEDAIAEHPVGVDARSEAEAPRWFVRLVEPDLMPMRRGVAVPGVPFSEIVIHSDPADEITEAWKEARSLLILLLAFFVIANVIVFIGIGRSLKPVNSILRGLEGIERGDYQLRLPQIRLPELDEIAQKFNHMAEVLESSREENRFLTKRTLAIQEEERRRLAHELHDGMGQSISAIKAMAVSIEQREPDQKIKGSASRIADVSTNVYEVVSKMMRRLRPVVLDELGLLPALQELVDDWNEHHEHAYCRFSSRGDLHHLSDDLRITVYRIVQECLTNAAKHSEASEVNISLQSRSVTAADAVAEPVSKVLEMIVFDNGRGFHQETRPHGLGLLGMRERVESLKGVFQLESSIGAGVRISAIIPLADEKNSDEQGINHGSVSR